MVYSGKNVTAVDVDENEDERKICAIPTALPADVGKNKVHHQGRRKSRNFQMKDPSTRKKAKVWQIGSG